MKKLAGRFVLTTSAALILAAMALPAMANAGDTLYQYCDPSAQSCQGQLEEIDQYAPNVSRVMNYYLWDGGTAAAQDYIRQANANRQKVIVPINGDWTRAEVRDHVDAVKNHAGTWGYYLGNWGGATPYSDAIANHDDVSKHPRVYIDATGQLGISRIEALAAAGDVEKIGFQCFPVWTTGGHDTMTSCHHKAAVAHDIDVAFSGVTGAWMVLQAFAFTDECSSDPNCAGPPLQQTGPYPTYSQQCEMRDMSTPGATHIMWYTAAVMTNNNFHGRLGNISRAAADPNCD
jgi:hypothetical protein